VSNKAGRVSLHTNIPRHLRERLEAAMERVDLPTISIASVVEAALLAHLPAVERLAEAAQAEREAAQQRQIIRRIERHLRKHHQQEQQ
jgi:hypothetical protein